MVDGAIDIPEGAATRYGPTESGRYLVEDKAGESFDRAQARLYSDRLKEGNLRTSDPEPVKGLIYIVENPKNAARIARTLANEGLDSRIYVATFDANKQLKFAQRPIDMSQGGRSSQ